MFLLIAKAHSSPSPGCQVLPNNRLCRQHFAAKGCKVRIRTCCVRAAVPAPAAEAKPVTAPAAAAKPAKKAAKPAAKKATKPKMAKKPAAAKKPKTATKPKTIKKAGAPKPKKVGKLQVVSSTGNCI